MRQSLQFGKLLAAGCTDALAAEKNAIPGYFTTQVTAAVCAVLAQQDGITIGKDFKGVSVVIPNESRSSLGRTKRPKLSTLRMIPVDFIG